MEEWLKNKTPENVASWIENPDAFFVVARDQDCGEIIGIGSLSCSGEILLCYLLPEALGKGVGRKIYDSLEIQARKWGLLKIVTYSTITARDFYSRQGFENCDDPVLENGYVVEFPMAKKLGL